MIPVSLGDLESLVSRMLALLDAHERVVLGVVGPPGSGKSTVSALLVAAAEERGVPSVQVPMDGFHLADVELVRLGLLDRKGAIETFDGHGFVSLLRRVRAQDGGDDDGVVYAPTFERTLEQPLAGAVPVLPEHRLVVTEGNYLLDEAAPWTEVRELLTESWYCELDDAERRRRLVARHIEFGKAPAEAENWVATVDEPNAVRVAARSHLADCVVNTLRIPRT